MPKKSLIDTSFITGNFNDPKASALPSPDIEYGDEMSKYDIGHTPMYDPQAYRADNQGNWDSLANMLVRGVSKAVLTIPETIGYLVDLPEMLGMVDEYDNKISEASRMLKEQLGESFPEYGAYRNEEFKPSSAEWWFTNGDSVIESLGYFIPGGAVAKGASALVKSGLKGLNSAKLLNKAKTIEEFGSAFSAATAMNYAETMQSAGEHFRTATERYIKEGGLSPEDAKKKAAEEASSIVWQGKVNLLFEMPAAFSLIKTLKGAKAGYSRANKDIGQKLRGLGEVGIQTTTEAAEELSLGFLEKEGIRKTDIGVGKEVSDKNYIDRFFEYAGSDEGLTAGLLGGLGGGLFAGSSSIMRRFTGTKEQQNLAKETIGKNSQEVFNILKDLDPAEKEEEQAVKENDPIKFTRAQKNKLAILAFKNAQMGTFEQFEKTLDDLSNITEEEAAAQGTTKTEVRSKIEDYKKEAATVEEIYNLIENRYSEYSGEVKNKIVNNLINSRVISSSINDYSEAIKEVYSKSKLSDPIYNELYNQQKTLKNILKSRKLTDAQREFFNNKLNVVEAQIPKDILLVGNINPEVSTQDLSQYSNPGVDILVSHLYKDKYAQELRLQEYEKELLNIEGDPKAYEEQIQQEAKEAQKEADEELSEKIKEVAKETVIETKEEGVQESEEDNVQKAEQTKKQLAEQLAAEGLEPEDIAIRLIEFDEARQSALAEINSQAVEDEAVLKALNSEETNEPVSIDSGVKIENNSTYSPTRHTIFNSPAKEVHINDAPNGNNLRSTATQFQWEKLDGKFIKDERGKSLIKRDETGRPIESNQVKEFDFAYLNNPETLVPGTELELFVDKDNPYEKDNVNLFSIKIRTKDGIVIGNLPAYKGTGNSELDALNLKIREYLFSNKDTSIGATVKYKTTGFFNNSKISFDGELIPTPNNISFLFDGKVELITPSITDDSLTYEGKVIGKGIPAAIYAVTKKSANGSAIPVQLQTSKINEKEANQIFDMLLSIKQEVNFDTIKKGDVIYIKDLQTNRFNKVNFVEKQGEEVKVLTLKGKTIVVSTNLEMFSSNYPKVLKSINSILYSDKQNSKVNIELYRISFKKDGKDFILSYKESNRERIVNELVNLYKDVNYKTLKSNSLFTDIFGNTHDSYADYLANSNSVTTDLDSNQPFYDAVVLLDPKSIGINKPEVVEEKTTSNFNLPTVPNNVYNIPILLDPKAKVRGDVQEYITEEVFNKAYEKDEREGAKYQTSATLLRRGGYSKEELNQLLPNWKELLPKQDEQSTFQESETLSKIAETANEATKIPLSQKNKGNRRIRAKEFTEEEKIALLEHEDEHSDIAKWGKWSDVLPTNISVINFVNKVYDNVPTETRESLDLLKRLFPLVGNTNIQILTPERYIALAGEELFENSPAFHSIDNKGRGIYINKFQIDEAGLSGAYIADIIAHEYLHGITSEVYDKYQEGIKLINTEKEFVNEINSIYNKALKLFEKSNIIESLYGLTNQEEFVSEIFGNPDFRKTMNSLFDEESGNLLTKFFKAISDYINRLLGITKNKEKISDRVIKSVINFATNHKINKKLLDGSSSVIHPLKIGNSFFSAVERKARVKMINFEFFHTAKALGYSLDTITKQQTEEVYEAIKKEFINDIATVEGQEKLQKVIDEWNYFVKLSKRSFQQLGFSYQDEKTFVSEGDVNTTESEARELWQEKSFSENLKSSLRKDIKLHLMYLPDGYKNAEGEFIYNSDDLGREKFLDFHNVYSYLQRNLSDLDTLDNMIEHLTDIVNNVKPELVSLLEDLTDPSGWSDVNAFDRFRNNFYSSFSNQTLNFLTVKNKGFAGGIEVDIFETNRVGLKRQIINDWLETYKNNITITDKGTSFNKQKGESLLSRYSELKIKGSLNEDQINGLVNILNEVGLTVSKEVVARLGENPKFISKYITNKVGGTISNLLNSLSKGIDIFNLAQDTENKGETTALNNLAFLQSLAVYDGVVPSFINSEGNSVYSINMNNAISKDFRKLKQEVDGKVPEIEKLFTDTFYNPSEEFKNHYLNELNTSEEQRNEFNWFVFEALTTESKAVDGTPYNKLSNGDWLATTINMWFNGNKKYGFYTTPTPGDKENTLFVKLLKFNSLNEDNELSEEAIDKLYAMFMQEASRIKQANLEVENWEESELIEDYHFLKGVNNLKDKSGKAFEFNIFKFANKYIQDKNINLSLTEDQKQEIRKELVGWFDTNVSANIGTLVKNAVIKNVEGVLVNQSLNVNAVSKYNNLEAAIRDFTFNNILGYNFLTGVTIGDPAFAGTFNNYVKRFGLWQTPGTDIGQGEYNQVTSKDYEYDSLLLKSYEELLKSKKVSSKQIEKILKAYKDINQTDAQGFVTLDRYLDILYRQGLLTDSLIAALDNLEEGTPTSEELEILLTPIKGTNVGYRIYNGKRIPIAVKYSIIPLLPAFTKNYEELDTLRKNMEERGVDELVYKSGNKLGTQGVSDAKRAKEWTITKMPNSSYRIPQVVPYKSKTESTFPSQAMKNIITNVNPETIYTINNVKVTGLELLSNYQELIKTNIEDNADKVDSKLGVKFYNTYLELLDRANYQQDPDKKQELYEQAQANKRKANEKLGKMLMSELLRRDNLPESYEDALQLDENGDFNIPLGFPLFSKKYEQILLSPFTKKIRKQKLPGMSAVNVSDFGIKLSNKHNLKYHEPVTTEDGTIIQAAEVLVSQDYLRNILKQSGIKYEGDITLDMLPEDAKYFIANRIPNQAKNSMVYAKIVGFLPKEQASQIIFPKEVVGQVGSDFDIDKSYLMFKTLKFDEDTNKFKAINYLDNSNSTIEQRYIAYNEYYDLKNEIRDIIREEVEESELDNFDAFISLHTNPILAEKLKSVLKVPGITDEDVAELIDDIWESKKYSFEEFKKLSIPQQNSKDARDSQIVNTFISILSNENHFTELLLPNNSDTLKEVRAEILDYYSKDTYGANILSFASYVDARERNLAGKALIGVFSLKGVIRGYLQILKPESTLFARFNDKVLNKIDGVYDTIGNFISDNTMEYQTGAVDNANNPILGDLNQSLFLSSVTTLLNDLGVDIKTNMRFVNQPIIRDLMNLYNQYGSTNAAYYKALNELAESHIADIKKENQEYAYALDGTIHNFTDKDLTSNLKKYKDNAKDFEYHHSQLNVLNSFVGYKEQSKIYDTITKILSADTAKNLNTIVNISEWLSTANEFIYPLFESSFDLSRLPERLPMVNAFIDKGIRGTNSISRLMPWGKSLFKVALSEFKEYAGSNLDSDTIEKFNYSLFNYLYTDEDSPLYLSVEQKEEMLYSFDKNIARRLQKLIDSELANYKKDPSYEMNLLVANLKAQSPSYMDGKLMGTNYATIKFNNSNGSWTADQKTDLQNAWAELYEDPKTKPLSIDLLKYTFMLGGFIKGPLSFIDLAPIEMLRDLGIVDFYKQELVPAFNGQLPSKDFFRSFMRQYKNVTNDKIVPTLSKIKTEGGFRFLPGISNKINGKLSDTQLTITDSITTKKYVIGKDKETDLPIFRPFVKSVTKKTIESEYGQDKVRTVITLFEFSGYLDDNTGLYTKTEILGDSYIDEMDMNNPINTSVLKKNNLKFAPDKTTNIEPKIKASTLELSPDKIFDESNTDVSIPMLSEEAKMEQAIEKAEDEWQKEDNTSPVPLCKLFK